MDVFTPSRPGLCEPVGQCSVPGRPPARVDGDEHRSRGPGIFGGYSCPKNPDPPSPRGFGHPRRTRRTKKQPRTVRCATGEPCIHPMSAIRPFFVHYRRRDARPICSKRDGRLVGMGEVSDATVSLCALCSGAVAVAAVSLTALMSASACRVATSLRLCPSPHLP